PFGRRRTPAGNERRDEHSGDGHERREPLAMRQCEIVAHRGAVRVPGEVDPRRVPMKLTQRLVECTHRQPLEDRAADAVLPGGRLREDSERRKVLRTRTDHRPELGYRLLQVVGADSAASGQEHDHGPWERTIEVVGDEYLVAI